MCCLESGSPDLVYRFGRFTGIGKGFQRADLSDDLVDLGRAVSAPKKMNDPVIRVAHLDLEVFAETEVVSYTIEAYME